jgi:uncharacterized protein
LADTAIVADTSPLIGLARIGRLSLLDAVFRVVYLPQAVFDEATADPQRPGATAIRETWQQGRLTLQAAPPPTDELAALVTALDQGEAEALLLARRLGVPLLIDERRGRRVAQSLNLTVIGTGAVLVTAKQRGLIAEVAPLLEQLKQTGYRLGDTLIDAILNRCGERGR